jgi:hypothetical protein
MVVLQPIGEPSSGIEKHTNGLKANHSYFLQI